MSLLDKASLIVTPNAYKASKLYSVVPSDGAGDMDVVRVTTATRVNSAGLIEVVPRNLYTYSEQFNNTDWTKLNATITADATTAPNGTLTADLLVCTGTAAGTNYVRQTKSINSNTHTLSFYAKPNANSIVRVAEAALTGQQLNYDLSNNTISGSGSQISGTITEDVNGWKKITFTYIYISGQTTCIFNINSLSCFIWGAQLNEGTTATEYFPTTTRLNIPRIDYTNGSCPSLLVEPQRTNLATNSDGNVSTYGTAINVTNASSSFNSFTNAIQFPNTALALAYKTIVTTVQTYAISVFIKMDDNSVPILSASQTTGNFCLVIAGAVVTNNLKVESYGNNVYRLSGTATSAGINANNGVIRFDTQVLKSFKITGIQLEAASYPTSYIPTVASTVTRNADVISKTGISSLIGQTEGTIFCDVNLNSRVTQTYFAISSSATTVTNYIGISFRAASIVFEVVTGSVLQAGNSLTNSSQGKFKLAIAYKNNDFAFYANGSLVALDNSGTVPVCNDIVLFNANFSQNQALNYNSVQLYKTRLTNDELAQLTTL